MVAKQKQLISQKINGLDRKYIYMVLYSEKEGLINYITLDNNITRAYLVERTFLNIRNEGDYPNTRKFRVAWSYLFRSFTFGNKILLFHSDKEYNLKELRKYVSLIIDKKDISEIYTKV